MGAITSYISIVFNTLEQIIIQFAAYVECLINEIYRTLKAPLFHAFPNVK